MAKTTITQDEVFQAAAAVLARGERPNVENVRTELGSRGSYSTIKPLLNAWRELQKQKAPEPALAVPETVVRAMEVAQREVWATAAALISREVTQVKEAAGLSLKEAEASASEAAAEVVRLEALVVTRDSEIETLRSTLAGLEARLSAAVALEGELRSRLTAEEERGRELASETDTAKEKAAAAESRASAAALKTEELAAGLEVAKAENQQEKQHAAVAKDAERRAREAAATAVSESDELRRCIAGLEKAASAAAATETELRERIKAESERNKALDSRVAEMVKELARLAGVRGKGEP